MKFVINSAQPSESHGFTLIELLVGISITLIVFSVGIAGYRDFSRRQALTGVSKELKGNLRMIQQLALTGQKPEGATCATLTGYRFSLTGNTGYTLAASCNDSNGAAVPDVVIKTVDLTPNGATITATVPNMKFKVLGQGTDLIQGVNSVNTITLTHTSGNVSNLYIGFGGQIR